MSRLVRAAAAASIFCAFPMTEAEATIYAGNPKLVVLMDHAGQDLLQGAARLHRLRLHGCGAPGPTLTVDQDFDPVSGLEIPIPAGDWCGVTLEWEGPITLEAAGFSGESDAAGTTSDLDPATPGPALQPFEITEGVIYGGNPKVVVWVE